MREDFKMINKKIEEDVRLTDNLLSLFAHANDGYAKCTDLSYYVNPDYVETMKAAQKNLEEGFLSNISDIESDKSIIEFKVQAVDGVYVDIWINVDRNRRFAMPGRQSLAFKYNNITYSTTFDVLIAIIEDVDKN